jgi:hypothetical protein
MNEENQRGQSVVWAIFLIALGSLFLLNNFGIITGFSFYRLLSLWPIALIALGLNLILGREYPYASYIIGIGAVIAAFVVLPLLPSGADLINGELRSQSYSEPVGEAQSATVVLDLSRYPTTISGVDGSGSLIEVELEAVEDVDFRVAGSDHKSISLGSSSGPRISFGFQEFFQNFSSGGSWMIHLDNAIPIDLSLDLASGRTDLNFEDLMLTSLEVDSGSEGFDAQLPATETAYELVIDGGSGAFDISIENEAQLDARIDIGSGSMGLSLGDSVDMRADIDGGSGSVRVDVSEANAVRVVVRDGSSGNVSIASWLQLVDDGGDSDADTGIWETDGYQSAAIQIEIIFDPGSGSFTLR